MEYGGICSSNEIRVLLKPLKLNNVSMDDFDIVNPEVYPLLIHFDQINQLTIHGKTYFVIHVPHKSNHFDYNTLFSTT